MIVAIVGCGKIAQQHLRAIDNVPGVQLAAVCDVDLERAKACGDSHGVPAVSTIGDLPTVDVVSVATPSGFHVPNTIEALQRTSATTVACEKPLALTADEARQVYEVASGLGKAVAPVYQLRYTPAFETLYRLVNEGTLGTVYQVVVNLFWNRNDEYYTVKWHGTRRHDGGVLFTQASHYVDMLLYLFGTPVSVQGEDARLRGLEVPDTTSVVMRFLSGTVASINATVSTYRKNFATEATVIAERGTIRLSGTNLGDIEIWDVDGGADMPASFTDDNAHIRGHEGLYAALRDEAFERLPSRDAVIAEIELMEELSRERIGQLAVR